MVKKLTFILMLALSVQNPILAQETRVSEEELTLDQLFMDANLQKLIGNEEKAIQAFENILESYPEHPAAAFELSRLYQKVDRQDDALKMAQMAVKNDPENKWYKIQLAEMYSGMESYSEAIELYEGLIKQEPRNLDLYYQQAFFYVKASDIKGALQVYENLEDRVGLSEEIVRRKHALYLGTGDFKKAGKELMRLTEAFPDNVDYKQQLASFYEQIDQKEEALEVYRQILDLDPDHPKANLAVAGADTGSGDEVEYLNALKPVFEDPTVSIDLKVGKILPLLQQMVDRPDLQIATALLELTDILERVHSDDAKSFAAAGDILMNAGRYNDAIQKYRQAIRLDDTVYPVWEQLLFALQVTGAAADQAAFAEQAMDVFPNQAMVYYNAALGYLGLADPGEAIYNLEQALLMAGQNKNLQEIVISAIGLAYTIDNNLGEAEDAFAKALEINPNSGLTNTRYAIYLSVKGETTQAEKILKTYEGQGERQAIFQEAQAKVWFAKNQLNQALDALASFQTAYSSLQPRQLEFLGDLYYKNERTEEALAVWKQAEDAGSKSKSLKKKIADKKL